MTEAKNANNDKERRAFAEKVKNMVGFIRQNLRSHGGDIELVNIGSNNAIKVRLQSRTEDCPETHEVLKSGVKDLLKQRIPGLNEVITVD